MKINVTVDLEDFYSEDESSFNEQILWYIQSQVTTSVWKTFQEKAMDSFKSKIDAELEQEKDAEIQRIVTKVFTDKKIKTREASKANPEPGMVTLFEYIEEKLHKSYFSEDRTASSILDGKLRDKEVQFEKMVSLAAEQIGEQLKDRYDLLFASQIVSNLNKNGMLKEDIAKILLNDKTQG